MRLTVLYPHHVSVPQEASSILLFSSRPSCCAGVHALLLCCTSHSQYLAIPDKPIICAGSLFGVVLFLGANVWVLIRICAPAVPHLSPIAIPLLGPEVNPDYNTRTA